jgi:hypothetical protein
LTLVLASGALAQTKETDKPSPSGDKSEAKDKRVLAGEFTGKLVRVEPAQKSLAVQIDIPYLNGRNIAHYTKDIELQAADDVKVRLLNPPTAFDAKGNPRKYTAKELKELRGPGHLPGYPGDFDSLKVDQIVQVTLKKQKNQPRYWAKKDKEASSEPKPVVTLIVILQEPRK